MKTLWAALAHVGVSALQTAAAVPFFSHPNPGVSILGNGAIQVGVQAGLIALQSYIAKLNSNTDPNGQKLTQFPDGSYSSLPTPTKSQNDVVQK